MFAQVGIFNGKLLFLRRTLIIVEIDECLDDPCDLNATCTNTDGSYICECSSGFTGDGETCISEFVIHFLSVLLHEEYL